MSSIQRIRTQKTFTGLLFWSRPATHARRQRSREVMNRTMLGLSSFLLLAGCSSPNVGPAEEAPVLRAWDPLTQAAPSTRRSTGESCTSGGKAACREGVCLHLEPHANAGYFCSRVCTADTECPEGWVCRAMVAGDPVSYCVPPIGWNARIATNRTTLSRAERPPPMVALPVLPGRDGGMR